MVVINLFSESWFNNFMGLNNTPLINHKTWSVVTRLSDFPNGDLSLYQTTLRVMPASFFFYMFFVIYALLFSYVCVQLLPCELLSKKVGHLREEDTALEKQVFIRGTRRRWSKVFCCHLPQVHKWRLTPRASHLLIDISHSYFLMTCMFNMLFLVTFLHREYLTSLIFLILLFITIILWYMKINAWYVIVTPKTDDEIKMLKAEFDTAHKDEELEIRDEKWNMVEAKYRAKPLNISFVEVFILHIPLSAYLGMISYVIILIAGYFTILFVGIGPGGTEGGWNMSDWYDEGWAWAMIALVSLVIIVISGKTKDPILPLFFSIGPAGIFWQNTMGTCNWDTTSGIAIRKPDAVSSNQRIKSQTPANGIQEFYQRGGNSGGRLQWFWNLTDDQGHIVNDDDWAYQGPQNGTDGSIKLQPAYWCKKAVIRGNNNYYTPDQLNLGPWAFRYQDDMPLTYYDETRNLNGDYFYMKGRCRRIYKDAQGLPVTAADQCDNLGLQRSGNPDVVRGFYWMEDLCIEDSGTCPYVFGKSPSTSHTPEYVLATATLYMTIILWIVSLGLFGLRYLAYQARKEKKQKVHDIFDDF
jgi:hypothetical protein